MITIIIHCHWCDERTIHSIEEGQAICSQCGSSLPVKERPRANARPEDYDEET